LADGRSVGSTDRVPIAIVDVGVRDFNFISNIYLKSAVVLNSGTPG
jgi:hypothetical protein